jgi:anti-anti-sigma factor
MTTGTITVEVRRLTAEVAGIAIGGDVTSAGHDQLMDAYARASVDGARVIILDFSHLDYMNSGGIGLLVTLLVEIRGHGQRLLAVGLSSHYRQILALTRIDEAIEVHETEAQALVAAGT